jgi:lipoprotein-anchoring transpeptidase ErfK/SrfK
VQRPLNSGGIQRKLILKTEMCTTLKSIVRRPVHESVQAMVPQYPSPHAQAPRPPQTPRPAPRKKPKQQKLAPWLIVGGMAGLGLVAVCGVLSVLLFTFFGQARLPNGVSVAGLPLGGQTIETATNRLQTLSERTLTLTDGTLSIPFTLGEMGITVDTQATLAALQRAEDGEVLQPLFNIDLNTAQSALIGISQQVNQAAIPGNPPIMGKAMEIPVTLDRLRVDVTGEVADGLLELDVIAVEPPPPSPDQPFNGQTTTHVVEPGQELALIAREYGVDMADIVSLNGISNPDLLFVGQELTIPAGGQYQPSAADAPPPSTNVGKAIVVSISDQRIYAYENGQLIRSHLTSTGRPETPTVLGDYSVYVKYQADDMSGPGYFLPQVPYTMYFHRGYAIHGTYWHNSFGRPMSHGCVNLPSDEAGWFFQWAEVGTPVRVVA